MKSEQLKVLILGYGSREHALAWKVAQSPRVAQLFVAPGNAGTAEIATNVPISDEDIPALTDFALENKIDLTIVGTNDPLALGVVDAFQAAGLMIFGPTQAAAQLESSKAFAKAFMYRHEIPTPSCATFNNYAAAHAHLATLPPNQGVVVKVSGLGKMGMGVTVCDNQAEAEMALQQYLVDKVLGDQTVIIEERIHGPELSLFALSDGHTVVPLIPVRDYKRIFDGDKGPNTGGIGAFSPLPDVDSSMVEHIMQTVIRPTIRGMAAEGRPYVGVLFAGLMMTDKGIQVIEFNSRFGNPEALIIMRLLGSDLTEAILACINGSLTADHVKMSNWAAATVVMTSPDYPAEQFPLGLPISGVATAQQMPGVELFHHGTALADDGELVTARGRVLAVSAKGVDVETAVSRAYAAVRQIHFEGAHYRQDIGVTHEPADSLIGRFLPPAAGQFLSV